MLVYSIINAAIYLISIIVIGSGGFGGVIGGIVLNLAAFAMTVVGIACTIYYTTDSKSCEFIKKCRDAIREDGDCESVVILRTTDDNSEPEEYEEEEEEEEGEE